MEPMTSVKVLEVREEREMVITEPPLDAHNMPHVPSNSPKKEKKKQNKTFVFCFTCKEARAKQSKMITDRKSGGW